MALRSRAKAQLFTSDPVSPIGLLSPIQLHQRHAQRRGNGHHLKIEHRALLVFDPAQRTAVQIQSPRGEPARQILQGYFRGKLDANRMKIRADQILAVGGLFSGKLQVVVLTT